MKNLKEFSMTETSLSRIFQHFNGDRPIVVITTFRGDKTFKDNLKRNKELSGEIKKAKYGFVVVDGHWVEKNGNNTDDTAEDSIFIIGDENDNDRLKGLAVKWMKKYNQDAIIFKEEKSKIVNLIFQDGREESLGNFNANKVGQAYTKLRGRKDATFVFESTHFEKNWIEKLATLVMDID